MLTDSRWEAAPYSYAEARALVDELGVSETLAVALVRRGHREVEDARAFLDPADDHDPLTLGPMASVVERLLGAVAAGEPITVHGDYDVDGVCATAIVVATMRALGAECEWHLPSRFDEGYGLAVSTVQRLAARGTKLLITVDCGITAVEAVAAARAAGMDVIVTDHHRPGEVLPECLILHPALGHPGSPGATGAPGYACPDLCATGVAYKLAQALYAAAGRDPALAEAELDLVALATVADLVSLTGENRALVRRGLAAARRSRRPGLRALLAVSKTDQTSLDEQGLAFRIAPRINAAGRLNRADAGLELMLTGDQARAAEIAAELDRLNRERRETELRILWEAESAYSALPEAVREAPALVLAGQGWHKGVIGIVASRLVERYGRPTVLIALDDDTGTGSGRSIPGFDLLAGLQACSDELLAFGGHRAAAGLTIEAGRVEAFSQAFCDHARATLSPEDLVPVQRVDALVGCERLGLDLAEELDRLRPFGMGNRGVSLLVPSASVTNVRPMGEGRHARFSLRDGAAAASGVSFGTGAGLPVIDGVPNDVVVRLEANEWNGAVEPRVLLKGLHPSSDALARARPPAGECDGDRTLGGTEEWWRRLDAVRAAPPGDLYTAAAAATIDPIGGARREQVDRRGACAEAVVAELISSGASVVALGADDFPLLADRPRLAGEFEHVVLVAPPPSAALQDLLAAAREEAEPQSQSKSPGYLHLAWGEAELAQALAAHQREYDLTEPMRAIFRGLRDAGGEPAEPALGALLRGESQPPRTPEQAGRCLRVLDELGLVALAGDPGNRALRVVSSSKTDLDRSPAFRAYRQALEEGKRFLGQLKSSQPSQSSSPHRRAA